MHGKAICAALCWTWEQYTRFQYETGLKYLDLYSAPDGVKRILESNREFWGWWKLNWNTRDEAFIEQDLSNIDRQQAEWIFRALHDAEVIVQDTYPNQWIVMPCIKAYTAALKAKAHVTVRP